MNKKIDFLVNKNIPTDLFGSLTIKVVLLVYDYPRCFIAENKEGLFFALTENNDSNENFGWNLTKVDLKDINDVNKGKKDIQFLFRDKDSYLLMYDKITNICKTDKVQSFEGEYEVLGSMFLTDFCDMDETFDFHSLQKISNSEHKSSISLVLEGDEPAKTSKIVTAINYIKAICKNLKSKLDILDSRLLVTQGSTVITFQFDNPLNNLSPGENQDTDISNTGVIEFGNFLSADEPEQILIETNHNQKTVKKYSNLTEVLSSKTELRPKIVLSVPGRKNVSSFDFRRENIKSKKRVISQAKKMFDERDEILEEEIIIKGVLTGILTGHKNHFSFRADNGRTFDGTVDFALVGNDNRFLVNGAYYSSTIKETSVSNKKGIYKTTHKLLKLEIIEEFLIYQKMDLFEE